MLRHIAWKKICQQGGNEGNGATVASVSTKRELGTCNEDGTSGYMLGMIMLKNRPKFNKSLLSYSHLSLLLLNDILFS